MYGEDETEMYYGVKSPFSKRFGDPRTPKHYGKGSPEQYYGKESARKFGHSNIGGYYEVQRPKEHRTPKRHKEQSPESYGHKTPKRGQKSTHKKESDSPKSFKTDKHWTNNLEIYSESSSETEMDSPKNVYTDDIFPLINCANNVILSDFIRIWYSMRTSNTFITQIGRNKLSLDLYSLMNDDSGWAQFERPLNRQQFEMAEERSVPVKSDRKGQMVLDMLGLFMERSVKKLAVKKHTILCEISEGEGGRAFNQRGT